MAKSVVISSDQLDTGFVLAPERYDPRRWRVRTHTGGVTLSDVAHIVREQISPIKARQSSRQAQYLILDTGDAREGAILATRHPTDADMLGSAKKIVQPGDVIISRLRPYLRQVAYIDDQLLSAYHDGETGEHQPTIVCSTEFYVLRSKNAQSIAFLVPYLLSATVQDILCAAQEGGHHPRFNQATLERLIVPPGLLALREELSRQTQAAIQHLRTGDLAIRRLSTQAACATP